jgi:hypothetical protein
VKKKTTTHKLLTGEQEIMRRFYQQQHALTRYAACCQEKQIPVRETQKILSVSQKVSRLYPDRRSQNQSRTVAVRITYNPVPLSRKPLASLVHLRPRKPLAATAPETHDTYPRATECYGQNLPVYRNYGQTTILPAEPIAIGQPN